MKTKLQTGFTVAEVLIVLGIIGVISIIVFPQFSSIKKSQVLKSAASDVVAVLDKAHSQTLSSVNSYSYGVHFQSDKVIIFRGTSYSAGDTNNVTTDIISPASITNVTLSGVSATTGDVYFNRLSGTPSKTGTITVTVSSTTKVITISATGGVSMN